MAAEMFSRYVWLAETIFSAGKINKASIDKLWAKSPLNDIAENKYELRSFHRHKDAIHDLLGLQVECDKHNGNLYSMSNLSKLKPGSYQEWVLSHLAAMGMLSDSEELRNRMLFDPAGKGLTLLSQVTRAMRQRNPIMLHIGGREKLFHPYALREHKGQWLLAGCEPGQEVKTFVIIDLAEIEAIDILQERHWKFPNHFDVNDLFRGYLGTDRSEKPQIVRIRVKGSLIDKLRRQPFHFSQKEKTKSGITEFEYTLAPNYDLISAIYALGPNAEVVYPETLRQAIKDDLQQKATAYGMKLHYAGEQLSLFD